jgi:hypothetical protein
MVLKRVLLAGLISIIFQDYLNKSLLNKHFSYYRKAEPEPKWKDGELGFKYQCPSCDSYLRFPIQFEDCGHYVCSSCLPDILRYEKKKIFLAD